jgi:hypothetical protein
VADVKIDMVLQGSKIADVRRLTDNECEKIGIPVDNMGSTYTLELSSGALLFPVSDRAMNSGGGWRGDFNSIESFEGEEIQSVSPMSDEYMEHLGWQNNIDEKSVVVKLATGQMLYTSSDSEGNGAGLLFEYRDGQTYEIVFE